ncbi:MAG: hypothetical protein K2P13_03135 [Lachnospiraceae bacterium]|nr:hypothetical protein [Lachnospiraceae bacterium]
MTAKLQLYCQTSYGICPEGLRFLGEDYFSQSLPSALSQACDAYLKTCDEIEHRGALKRPVGTEYMPLHRKQLF